MKKYLSILLCLFFCSYPIEAADADPHAGLRMDLLQTRADNLGRNASADLNDADDEFYNELINQDYGCDQSPAFLNRENINPNESDYGYGATDGYY